MAKIKVALIRGAFLNPNELANYVLLQQRGFSITTHSSQRPLGVEPNLENYAYPSFADWPVTSVVRFLANRTLGDMHALLGLEKKLSEAAILDTADPYYYYSYQAARYKLTHPYIKLVSTYCETIPHNNEKTWAKRRLKSFTMAKIDLFVVHTNRPKQCLQKEGIPEQKIKLLPLGVDLRQFSPRNKSIKPGLIVYVGRLVAEKGVWLLYQCFKNLVKNNNQAQLNLVGQGSLSSKLRRDICQSGLQNKVRIYSHSYHQIIKEYQRADILVAPSYHTATWEEQYGMALIEAMACGKAIVTTSCGAIPEVVGRAAIICPENNQAELYRAIKTLIAKPELKQKLGQLARKRAEKHFDRRLFADTIKASYEKLLDRHTCA